MWTKKQNVLLCFCGNGRDKTAVLQLCDANICTEFLIPSHASLSQQSLNDSLSQGGFVKCARPMCSTTVCVTGIPEERSGFLVMTWLSLTLGWSPLLNELQLFDTSCRVNRLPSLNTFWVVNVTLCVLFLSHVNDSVAPVIWDECHGWAVDSPASCLGDLGFESYPRDWSHRFFLGFL